MYRESMRRPDEHFGREKRRIWSGASRGKGARLESAFREMVRRRASSTFPRIASIGISDGPRRNKAAIIWEGEPGEKRTLTYQQLHREVCRFANVLKRNKIRKGDRVIIYLPTIPEAAIAMLACARIGAVHSVVFGGFSADSIRDRIADSGAIALITADGSYRRGGNRSAQE